MKKGDGGQLAERLEQSEGEGPPDIPRLMAEIRERIRADVEAHRDPRPSDPRPSFMPLTPDEPDDRKAGELRYSEDLRYLNNHYGFAPQLELDAVATHRRGPLAQLIVRMKRKVLQVVWDYLLKDYFEQERQYQAHVVRYLNEVSTYVDARDASNFWELIRKIDYDVTKAVEKIDRLSDEYMASLRSAERRLHDALDAGLRDLQGLIQKLQSSEAQHQDRLATLESVSSGLESIVSRWSRPGAAGEVRDAAEGAQPAPPDYSYVLLENRFRGSEDDIKARMMWYAELFDDVSAEGAVLEIGGGRGELLSLFAERARDAYSVDTDAAMVEACQEKGLRAMHGDGLLHLSSLEDNSLAGLLAIQVVEHLEPQQVQTLCELCAAKIQPGGLLVFETINPRSLLALSSNYFRDPTHIWPFHPDTLSYMVSLSGIEVREVKYLSPVSDEAKLRPLPVEEYMTPRWAYAVERINANLSQLNELLYGFQDYCIIGEVR